MHTHIHGHINISKEFLAGREGVNVLHFDQTLHLSRPISGSI